MENRYDRKKSYYSKFKLLKTSFLHSIHRIGHVVKDPISKRGGAPYYFDQFFSFLHPFFQTPHENVRECQIETSNILAVQSSIANLIPIDFHDLMQHFTIAPSFVMRLLNYVLSACVRWRPNMADLNIILEGSIRFREGKKVQRVLIIF